jgi:hypothetical protein
MLKSEYVTTFETYINSKSQAQTTIFLMWNLTRLDKV